MSLTGKQNIARTAARDRIVYDTLMRRQRPTPSIADAFDAAMRARQAGDGATYRTALIVLAAAAMNCAELAGA